MNQEIDECDLLRQAGNVYEPDTRTLSFVLVDRKTGQSRKRIIQDQYEAISCFKLNETVPNNVVTHFETSKNVYLYAWFVYRFYPVAEQQALASLEFALRERFPDFVKEHPRAGLKKLLVHAIGNGCLRNELFSCRQRWAWRVAETRHLHEVSMRMMADGLTEIEWSDADVVVTEEDLNTDWLKIFMDIFPEIRNRHAHGSGELMPMVRHTFEVVYELINQLYPARSSTNLENT